MNTPEFRFSINDADEEEGLNDPGIEAFRHAPYESLARECGQNSLDAHDPKSSKPVELVFRLLEESADKLPGGASLKSALERCHAKFTNEPAKTKEQEFFANALDTLKSPVKILEVSDSNTKGLMGPAIPGTPFHALVKSSGVSEKDVAHSAGSFGIGKFAAFAASALRTVFYSTQYPGPKDKQTLAQGKALLVSHLGADNKSYRKTGYWGADSAKPFTDLAQAPPWMRRQSTGTSVFIAGFISVPDWESRIAITILKNFFGAIGDGKLVVQIGTNYSINKTTLKEHFASKHLTAVAEESTSIDDFLFAAQLYETTLNPSSDTELELSNIGKFRIRVRLGDELPKRVMFIRNGMRITDNLSHFGERFARFPMYKNFVALVEPASAESSAVMKEMESPQHNELSAERIVNDKKKASINTAMRSLAKRIRETIKGHALPPPAKHMVLDELSEFLSDTDPAQTGHSASGETDPEKLNSEPHETPTPFPQNSKNKPGNKGGASSKGKGSKTKKQGGGEKKGRGRGNHNAPGASHVAVHELRYIRDVTGVRRLSFTPESSGPCRIAFFAPGISDETPLTTSTTSVGELSNGCVIASVVAGLRVSIEFGLEIEYDGPISATFTPVQA